MYSITTLLTSTNLFNTFLGMSFFNVIAFYDCILFRIQCLIWTQGLCGVSSALITGPWVLNVKPIIIGVSILMQFKTSCQIFSSLTHLQDLPIPFIQLNCIVLTFNYSYKKFAFKKCKFLRQFSKLFVFYVDQTHILQFYNSIHRNITHSQYLTRNQFNEVKNVKCFLLTPSLPRFVKVRLE